jgi:sugar phosphate isomerase/epimerase
VSGAVPLVAGLCSVTLRDRSVGEVAELAAGCGLEVIEWGGDVHVPAGDLTAAAAAAAVSRDLGLRVCSYGSYLFCDAGAGDASSPVLDTAEALGAPTVRVWAPYGVEPGAPAAQVAAAVASIEAVAAGAADRGLGVYLEYHAGTLTATAASAVALLDAVGAPNLRCAWQPPYWGPRSEEDERADLEALGDRLGPVHVYAWSPDGRRHPLEDEADRWPARLAAAATAAAGEAPVGARPALLEFVVDDDPANLAADAAVLLRWIEGR